MDNPSSLSTARPNLFFQHLLITPKDFAVHSQAIRAAWEVFNQAALPAASYQCSPATATRKMSLLISPPVQCQGGESNPDNEVKKEKLWEEKWSLVKLSLMHFFLLLFVLCVYYFPPVFHSLCNYVKVYTSDFAFYFYFFLPVSSPMLYSSPWRY